MTPPDFAYDSGCGTGTGEINTSLDPVEGAWPEWIAEIGPPREGAQYYQQCVYRPEAGCRMRSLSQPFCKVCRQHYSLVYFGHDKVHPTAPLESISPGLPLQVWIGEEIDFSVATRLGIGTTNLIGWEIEGPGYPDPTPVGTGGPAYSHAFTELGDYTLSCEVVADTNLIKPPKNGANVDVAVWPVHVVDPAVDSDHDGVTPFEGDCVDTNPSIYPGAPRLCDGLNNDCDDPTWPVVPPTEADDDADGYIKRIRFTHPTYAQPDGITTCSGLEMRT